MEIGFGFFSSRNLSHCLFNWLFFGSGYLSWVCLSYFYTEALLLCDDRDRTGVIYGQNILSFRAIFNDVRNSIDRVHQRVRRIGCYDHFNL